MAPSQLEGNPDSGPIAGDDTAKQAQLALHSEYIAASGRQAAQPTPGDAVVRTAAPGQDQLEQQLSRSGKMLLDAMKDFEAAPDKKAAMRNLAPKYEGAITQADTDFDSLGKAVTADMKKLKPDIDKVEKDLKASLDKVNEAFVKDVPDTGKQPAVAAALELYFQLDPSDPQRKDLEGSLLQYGNLMTAVKGLKTVFDQSAPVIEKVMNLQTQIEQASLDRVQTRVGYARALHATGDDVKAWLLYKESREIANGGQEDGRPKNQPIQRNHQKLLSA